MFVAETSVWKSVFSLVCKVKTSDRIIVWKWDKANIVSFIILTVSGNVYNHMHILLYYVCHALRFTEHVYSSR